jgi:hypothetical protein
MRGEEKKSKVSHMSKRKKKEKRKKTRKRKREKNRVIINSLGSLVS